MKILLALVWLAPTSVIAQATPEDGWGIVAAYGAAAPFALLCLWVMNRKDKEIETLRAEIAKVTEAGMGQVVPALVRSTETVADAAKGLEAATTMMHQLAARSFSPDALERWTRAIRAVEKRLDDLGA